MRFTFVLLLCLRAYAQTLHGVVDIHVHAAPDSVPRSVDVLEATKYAQARGLRAIVLKNHYESTASMAALAQRQNPRITVFGGIALNRTVGGLNTAAVERMTRVEGGRGKIVWMPTFDSENQVRFSGENRPFVRISQGGALLPETLEMLQLIADKKLVLATGHSTPVEVLMLIREAKKRGVTQIVVTHGMLAPVSMSVAQLKEAVALGAYVEFVSNAMLGSQRSASFADYANAMKSVGVDHCILSSDFGQAGNPLHADGLEEVMSGLHAAGMTVSEIDQVAKINPARLLGLEPSK